MKVLCLIQCLLKLIIILKVTDNGKNGSGFWGFIRSVTNSNTGGENVSSLKQEVAALEVSMIAVLNLIQDHKVMDFLMYSTPFYQKRLKIK